MTFITEPLVNYPSSVPKRYVKRPRRALLENIFYSCSIYSYGALTSVISYSSKDAAKIHFFRKVCEKKVRFFEKNFHRFATC